MTEAFNWNVWKEFFFPIFCWYQITLISDYAGANCPFIVPQTINGQTGKKATEESFNNSATRKKAKKDRRQLSEDKCRFQCSAVLRYHICQFDGPHISHAWNHIGCELPCDLPVCTVIPWHMCSLGYHPRLVSSSCSQPALGLLLLTTLAFIITTFLTERAA